MIHVIIVIYLSFAFFVSATYMWSFLARTVFLIPSMTIFIVHRVKMDDEFNPVQGWLTIAFMYAMVELIQYTSMKAKAKLFYQLKRSEQQQRQMADLLDAVPDSVLICSKGSHEQHLRPIYANSKTSAFFGKDIFNYNAPRKKSMLKSVKNPK